MRQLIVDSFLSSITFGYLSPLIQEFNVPSITYDDLTTIHSNFFSDLFDHDRYIKEKIPKINHSGLLRSLFRANALNIILAISVSLVLLILTFLPSFLLGKILEFLLNNETMTLTLITQGIALALLLLSIHLFQTILSQNFIKHLFHVGLQVESILQNHIYHNMIHRPQNSVDLLNLISQDTRQIGRFVSKIYTIWNTPLTIILSLFLIFRLTGFAVIFAILAMMVIIPVTIKVSQTYSVYLKNYYKTKDKRMAFMSNTLNSIKTVKYLCAEEDMVDRVHEIRKEEIKDMKSAIFLDVLQSSLQNGAIIIMFALTIIANFFMGHTLEITEFFMLMNLFHVLEVPLTVFGDRYIDLMNTQVCWDRILLHLENLEKLAPYQPLTGNGSSQFAIQTKNLNIHRVLKKVTLDIPWKKMICVMGENGSGKSQFIEAICNFTQFQAQELMINGTIAYCSQIPFLMNTTIKNNILFGKDYNKEEYGRVLSIAQLETDLQQLPNLDDTMVGINGSNLSGGQRTRVSLARALYSNRDILVLDSVFTSLDPIVQRSLFDEIRKIDTTILMVSNNVEFANQCDLIITMKDGSAIMQKPTEYSIPTFSSKGIDITAQKHKIQLEMPKKPTNFNITFMDHVNYFFKYQFYLPISLCIILVYAFSKIVFGQYVAIWLTDSWNMSFQVYFLMFVILSLFQICMIPLQKYLFSVGGMKASETMHREMFESVIHAPIGFFQNAPDILNRFKDDVPKVDVYVPSFSNIFFNFLGHLTVSFLIVGLTSPFAIPVVAVIGIIFMYLLYIVRIPHLVTTNFVESSKSGITSLFSSTDLGIKVINIFGQNVRFKDEFRQVIEYHHVSRWLEVLLARWLSFRMEVLAAAFTFLIVVICIVFRTSINYSIAALSITFSLSISEQFNSAIKIFFYLETGIVSVKRMFDYSNLESEHGDQIQEEEPNWPHKGVIRFDHVYLSYDSVHKPINNMTLEFPNQIIGIVGRTGSGKSTLFHGILGFISPDEGTITIDHVDIQKVPLNQLRRTISMIPQDPSFIDDSIRFNLDPQNKHYDASIWKILESLNLKSKMNSEDISLDDSIRKISSFSNGEKHMLMLGRGLLSQSKIVLLDEVNSNLDKNYEAAIMKVIKEKLLGKTILIIAHNLTALADVCDRILVLKNGEIEEYDETKTLLKDQNSTFYKMFHQK